jgi:polysaccharide deacetylase family protein (PEP-CTERM system associated)
MVNALTIDLEEWFCVSNFEHAIRRADWPSLESRVEESTERILALLERRGTAATFFVLGWVAERHPRLIARLAEGGHEIACHGYHHELVYDLTPERFAADLSHALRVIEQASGARCRGYRAPSFSLRRNMDWAWRLLAEAGFRYDSSVYPVAHDRYGEPDAPRFPHAVSRDGTTLVEFPPSTLRLGARNLAVAGGGWFRLYPLALTRWAIRRINAERQPAVVYLHPWEFDPDQPVPAVSRRVRWRHRVGLASVPHKLDRLLDEFRFDTMARVLQAAGHLDRAA